MNLLTLKSSVAQLDAYYAATSAALTAAAAAWFGPPAGTISMLKVQLEGVDRYRARLDSSGDLGAAALEGRITEARWVAILNEQGRSLETIWSSLGENTTAARFWNEVIVQSGSDLVQLGGKTADQLSNAAGRLAEEGPGLFRWAVVALVAYVALQAIKVAR